MTRIISILFPVGVPEAFDYLLPEDVDGAQSVQIGQFVYAPLGQQIKLGVVWSLGENAGERNLKPALEIKKCPPLSLAMVKFIGFVARYNCTRPGLVLRMVIRSYKALEPSPIVTSRRSQNK